MSILDTLKNMAAKKTVVVEEVVPEVTTPEVGCENCEFNAEKAPTCSVCGIHTRI